MARIYPSNALDNWRLIRRQLPLGKQAEYETLEKLRDELPDSIVVYFGTTWSIRYGDRIHARETDFIVVNREGRCILVEQKMGALQETPKGLCKNYGSGSKDIPKQIHDSRDGLRDQFRKQHGNGKGINVDYLLYCPGHEVKYLNATGIDRQNIIDKRNKKTLFSVLKKRLKCEARKPTKHGQKVHRFLRQSLSLVPDVSTSRDLAEKRFSQLLGGSLEFVAGIRISPMRMHISGVAGSGKSHIAQYLLERSLREADKRILFVCFNNPLMELVSNQCDARIDVSTFHGLIHNFCSRDDVAIDYAPGQKSGKEWQRLLEEVIENVSESDAVYDVLIIDEGQDLGREAYEFIRLFGKDDCDIYWLEDRDQELGQASSGPIDIGDFVGITLKRNYRSPLSIASVINKFFPDRFSFGNETEGLGVDFVGYRNAEDQLRRVNDAVERAVKRGFEPSQIAIVSLSGQSSATLANEKTVAGIGLRRLVPGKYEGSKQVYTDGQIVFDTIRRYKGQQAPLVILTDVDFDPSKSFQKNALYCGMTRATLKLIVLYNERNEDCSRFIKASAH